LGERRNRTKKSSLEQQEKASFNLMNLNGKERDINNGK
jgi:hypothetical protein